MTWKYIIEQDYNAMMIHLLVAFITSIFNLYVEMDISSVMRDVLVEILCEKLSCSFSYMKENCHELITPFIWVNFPSTKEYNTRMFRGKIKLFFSIKHLTGNSFPKYSINNTKILFLSRNGIKLWKSDTMTRHKSFKGSLCSS